MNNFQTKPGWQPGNFRSQCPIRFSKDVLGMTDTYIDVLEGRAQRANALTFQQKELIQAPLKHSRTCVRSAHSLGKTTAISVLSVWWLTKKRDNMVLLSSMKADQIKRQVIPWVHRYYEMAFGEASRSAQGFIYPDYRESPNWFCLIVSGQRTESFASYHPHGDGEVLVIIDEASHMNKEKGAALEGLISNEQARLILLGNPLNTRLGDPFRAAFKDEAFHHIHWKTRKHPNIKYWDIIPGKDPNRKPIYPNAISKNWIIAMEEKHGPDSDFVRARCYGEFPLKLRAEKGNMMFDPQELANASGISIEELLDEEGMHRDEEEREELFEFQGQGHQFGDHQPSQGRKP